MVSLFIRCCALHLKNGLGKIMYCRGSPGESGKEKNLFVSQATKHLESLIHDENGRMLGAECQPSAQEPLGQRSPLHSVSALLGSTAPRNRGCRQELSSGKDSLGSKLSQHSWELPGSWEILVGCKGAFPHVSFLSLQGRAGSSAGLHTPCKHQALAAPPETAQVPMPRNPRAVSWELPSHAWELPSHT